jgi:hypothetical protein
MDNSSGDTVSELPDKNYSTIQPIPSIYHCSEEIITIDEKNVIVEWAISKWGNFFYNSYNAGYYIFLDSLKDTNDEKNDQMYNLFMNIRQRIVDIENLHGIEPDPSLYDFIYHMDKGTKLHKHKDANSNDGYHVRFNLIVQLSEGGGIPIYAGKKIIPKERCYIICRSGLDYHTSTNIEGDKPKIVISYSFNFPKDTVDTYSKIFSRPFSLENMSKV